MITLRPMRSDDIGTGLALCRAAGWNQLSRDWELFLKLSPAGCIVATIGDKVVGTVATICYQGSFCWIGMVLVDPAHRGEGIGTKLLQEALDVLENEETVKLDATPAGREIYLKLNFKDEYPVKRMTLVKIAMQFFPAKARPMQKRDIETIANFDRKVFGADRKPLLECILEGAPEYAFMIEEENEIQGYCLGRHGNEFIHIGPVIAKSGDVAKKLVLSALMNVIDKPVILDATQFDREWMDWLASIGFKEQRHFIRMYRGQNNFPGMAEKQFAILGPEFG